jgi:hypothetical protein
MLVADRHGHVVRRREILQDAQHVLFPLQRLEQAPQGVAAPCLRVVGEVRDPADEHVAARAPCVAMRSTSAATNSTSWTPVGSVAAICSSDAWASR